MLFTRLTSHRAELDAGSWDMDETHAYRRRRDWFGRDEAPRLAARTLREAEINGTRIKCAAPRHELTTFIPRQGASWLHVDSPLARSRFLG